MNLNGPERPSFLYLGYLTCLPNLPNRLIDDGSHAERVGIQAEKKYHFRMQKLKFWNVPVQFSTKVHIFVGMVQP